MKLITITLLTLILYGCANNPPTSRGALDYVDQFGDTHEPAPELANDYVDPDDMHKPDYSLTNTPQVRATPQVARRPALPPKTAADSIQPITDEAAICSAVWGIVEGVIKKDNPDLAKVARSSHNNALLYCTMLEATMLGVDAGEPRYDSDSITSSRLSCTTRRDNTIIYFLKLWKKGDYEAFNAIRKKCRDNDIETYGPFMDNLESSAKRHNR